METRWELEEYSRLKKEKNQVNKETICRKRKCVQKKKLTVTQCETDILPAVDKPYELINH